MCCHVSHWNNTHENVIVELFTFHFATSLLMDRLNDMQQQDQQRRQEAAVAEYKFALKVLTTIGTKM